MDERSIAAAGMEHLPPLGLPDTPGGPAEARSLDDPRVLQILSTEHWSLLSARSLVYNEAFARAGMFLTFLSASLVALSFMANAMSFGRSFLVIAALLLVVDLVIGLATLGRMLDASVDDLRAIAGMNRIRHAYVEIAPAIEPYLTSGTHDDTAGVLEAYGDPRIRTGLSAFVHGLTTAGGMVMLIDALIGGALAGVIVLAIEAEAGPALAVGALTSLVLFFGMSRYAYRVVAGFESSFASRFPTPPRE